MDENDLEKRLCEQLRVPAGLAGMSLHGSTTGAATLRDLVGGVPYEVIEDDSSWNQDPTFMRDIIGGMTPDIVLRSKVSGQNRIYLEVKRTRPLNYGKADSQVVRYFLHLLATTERRPSSFEIDIRRAIILAAPAAWFTVPKNAEVWSHFMDKFSALAAAFDVTLAELRLPAHTAALG